MDGFKDQFLKAVPKGGKTRHPSHLYSGAVYYGINKIVKEASLGRNSYCIWTGEVSALETYTSFYK